MFTFNDYYIPSHPSKKVVGNSMSAALKKVLVAKHR